MTRVDLRHGRDGKRRRASAAWVHGQDEVRRAEGGRSTGHVIVDRNCLTWPVKKTIYVRAGEGLVAAVR